MKPKLILCLALLFSGGLFGRSTAHGSLAVQQTEASPLYLYWGTEAENSAKRFLSAQIYLNEEILIGGNDFLELKGHIDQRGTNLIADLMGSTGQQSQFYRGSLILEKPFFAQGGAASGGAGGAAWFLLSTNADCRTILEHVNLTMGFTNSPFNHSVGILSSPVMPKVSSQIDPATGLPWNNSLVNPTNGLPMTADSPISVSLAITADKNSERRIYYPADTNHTEAAHFQVIFTNTSDKQQRLWQEWCSWGYFGLTFKLTDQSGKQWVAEKKGHGWTFNAPDWWTLESHASFVMEVYFADTNAWVGFPVPTNGSQTVTLQAVLEFRPDDKSRQLDVWTGRVVSQAEKVTFIH